MLTNSELNEAIRMAQESCVGGFVDQSNHLSALRAEQLRRAKAVQLVMNPNWNLDDAHDAIVIAKHAVKHLRDASLSDEQRYRVNALAHALEKLP